MLPSVILRLPPLSWGLAAQVVFSVVNQDLCIFVRNFRLQIFEDAYKSPLSIIILDDIER